MKIVHAEESAKPNGTIGVIYGPEGIGKTSLAAELDRPLFFDAEKGAYGQKVDKLDEEISLANMLKVMQELIKDSQGYKTLVFDTADAIELKMLADFCAENKVNGIEDFGYGKGYTYHTENFAKLLEKMRDVAESGMNVVIVAHAEPRKFETPDERGTYDRWTLKMMKQTAGLVKQNADWIIFINYKINIVQADKKAGETKAHATGGKRWCYTSHTNAYDAKSRKYIELPEDCSLDDMAKKLPVALRNAVNPMPVKKSAAVAKKEEPKAEQKKPEPKAEEPKKKEPPKEEPKKDSESGDRPLLAQLRESMAAYDITDGEMFEYGNEKHSSRYGEVGSIEEWDDKFIEWLLKGMEKISKKIKA